MWKRLRIDLSSLICALPEQIQRREQQISDAQAYTFRFLNRMNGSEAFVVETEMFVREMPFERHAILTMAAQSISFRSVGLYHFHLFSVHFISHIKHFPPIGVRSGCWFGSHSSYSRPICVGSEHFSLLLQTLHIRTGAQRTVNYQRLRDNSLMCVCVCVCVLSPSLFSHQKISIRRRVCCACGGWSAPFGRGQCFSFAYRLLLRRPLCVRL